jgi:hypothetical protein
VRPDEHRDVHGRNLAGSTHLHRNSRARDEAFDERADRRRLAAADVVGGARETAVGQRAIRAHGVADVGEIAPRLEVANQEPGSPAGLDARDLLRDTRRDERRRLPGPMWLNARATITSRPSCRAARSASVSGASLLKAYPPAGAMTESSVSGSDEGL